MKPSEVKIDERGIVRSKKTEKIIAVLFEPTPRTVLRYRFKLWRNHWKNEIKNFASAASKSTEGAWNRRGSSPSGN